MNLKIKIIAFFGLLLSLSLVNGDRPVFDEDRLLEHVKTLSSDAYEGRGTGQMGIAKARAYIIAEFNRLGLQPLFDTYEQAFEFEGRSREFKAHNVLGLIKGSTYPEQYIVISAHYDHLGIRSGTIYNGADDNASGVAALFAFAEVLRKNPPQHSVILAAFDAEEMGLQGARYFVDQLGDREVVLNINMDMIGRSAKDELYVVGSRYNETLKGLMSSFKNPTSSKLLIGHDGADNKQDWTYASDHAPFHSEGIPFLYFGNEDHEAYHQPNDDFEFLTPSFYKNAVAMIISVFQLADGASL